MKALLHYDVITMIYTEPLCNGYTFTALLRLRYVTKRRNSRVLTTGSSKCYGINRVCGRRKVAATAARCRYVGTSSPKRTFMEFKIVIVRRTLFQYRHHTCYHYATHTWILFLNLIPCSVAFCLANVVTRHVDSWKIS